MNPILRNILAILGGVLAGGFLNMGIILISGKIIPPPEGADLTTMEGITAAMPMMEAKHFLMPFLAHALGTLLAAFIAAKFVSKRQMIVAISIGIWFMIGGIMNMFMLPSPMWFNLADGIAAYIPMAYLGARFAMNNGNNE